VISWNELPKYAAYPIKEIIKKNSEIEIISTKSKLPIKGLDKIINKKILWIKETDFNWKDLKLKVPDIFFQAGWNKKSFLNLGKEVKKNGGKVVLLSDNSFKNTFRQKIGSIIFKIEYSNYFDAIWVPGKLGVKLMKFFDVPRKDIFEGQYCSNEEIYKKGKNLSKRPKTFIFIGQLIERKGIVELLSSFKKFILKNSDWKLIIVGNGPLRTIIPKHKNIKYLSFKNPMQISRLMQNSRFLVLPSRSDHWPLVVNEAAHCGCGLIVSNVVGNIPELTNSKNSFIFKVGSEESLLSAIRKASNLSVEKLDLMFEESLKLSSKFGISNWVKNYYDIINYLKDR